MALWRFGHDGHIFRFSERYGHPGAVKVTPAHDPNDFEMGKRDNLQFINILTGDGRMSEDAGPYKGLDRFECRKNVLQDLEGIGHLEKVTDHNLAIGHCYRCKTVVEPYLSKQWFVKIRPLAEEAIKAVREGQIKIIPSGWENSYFDWMENIRDWCISRQIWWGHRIPVWYCRACAEVLVSRDTPSECKCGSKDLIQDEDVLDTWFFSALWPFSTLAMSDLAKADSLSLRPMPAAAGPHPAFQVDRVLRPAL